MTSPNSTPHRLTRRLAMAGVSILAAAVLAACSGGHAEEAGMPPPPQVSAAPVLIKPVSQWDDFSGRVEAVQSVELRPRVSGYIDKVNYVEGEEVKKGDVLFTIDARSYQAEYDRAVPNWRAPAPSPPWPAANPSAPRSCPISRPSPPKPGSSGVPRLTRPVPACRPRRPRWMPPR